jgi:hypothetical protein
MAYRTKQDDGPKSHKSLWAQRLHKFPQLRQASVKETFDGWRQSILSRRIHRQRRHVAAPIDRTRQMSTNEVIDKVGRGHRYEGHREGDRALGCASAMPCSRRQEQHIARRQHMFQKSPLFGSPSCPSAYRALTSQTSFYSFLHQPWPSLLLRRSYSPSPFLPLPNIR